MTLFDNRPGRCPTPHHGHDRQAACRRSAVRRALGLSTAAWLCSAAIAQADFPEELDPANGPLIVGFDNGVPEEFDDEDLTVLDLEDLLNIEVTVVSRKAESLSKAPAAVYVITGEEIRRAGHSSIQEALRMAPGVFVSRWTGAEWDATIRGFGPGVADANLAYLNQVLVMVDGVVVYTPLFAGTWWGLQDMDIAHIDRIEIIRGPSGILWGANAFHGLINIVTKDSGKTTGRRVSARISRDENFVTLRSSGRFTDGVSYSAFARRSRFDALRFDGDVIGLGPSDLNDWGIQSGGLQFDGVTETGKVWRTWGRGYQANVGEAFEFAAGEFDSSTNRKNGGQLSFSIDDPETGTSFRASYVKDFQRLRIIDSLTDIDAFQFEARRDLELGESHQLMFGLGYDYIHSSVDLFTQFFDETLRQNNVRAFASDTWSLPSLDLAISVGIQAVHHEFSGFDLQPSIRFSWAPEGLGAFWASGSRAIRTPSIEEEVFGNGTLDNEVVVAAEAGWRGSIADGVSLDLAVFYNDYDKARIRFFDPVTFEDLFENGGKGHGKGGEVGIDVRATDWWTLRSAYSFNMSSHSPEGVDPQIDSVDTQYPVHMLNVRSYVDLADRWELDSAVYYVERFDGAEAQFGADGPEYWRGDIRLGWRPNDNVRVSLGVQGFNDPSRSEFGQEEVRRQVFASIDLTR